MASTASETDASVPAAEPSRRGGRQAVAAFRVGTAIAWRNLVATGATPLALTNNLNFGNPERPAIMGQFVGCVRGIGEAADDLARRLDRVDAGHALAGLQKVL